MPRTSRSKGQHPRPSKHKGELPVREAAEVERAPTRSEPPERAQETQRDVPEQTPAHPPHQE